MAQYIEFQYARTGAEYHLPTELVELEAVTAVLAESSTDTQFVRVDDAGAVDLSALPQTVHDATSMAFRGLEVKPGTPTDAETDDLAARLSSELGVDITTTPDAYPGTSMAFAAYLKNQRPDLQPGEEGYIKPFDVTRWE